MKRILAVIAFLAACAGTAWALGGVGDYCLGGYPCRTGLVCNLYYGTCQQYGSVGAHCVRDVECRSPLYCSVAAGYRCAQRTR